MNSGLLITSIISLFAGVIGGYFSYYLRGALTRREQLATLLADYYSSVALAYYAWKDFRDVQERKGSMKDASAVYQRYDENYKNFLASSTKLASLVHPKLREKVLSIEDLWDEIGRGDFSSETSKRLFDDLDEIRDKVLKAISYNWLTDPYWKFTSHWRWWSIRIATPIAIVLGIVLIYWFSCGVTGDVFSISSDGKPVVAPGAQVTIFSTTPDKNMGSFRLSAEFTGVQKSKNCTQVYDHAFLYFGQDVTRTRTDQQGHFSVRLRPGSYAVVVRGPAGAKQSLWLDAVQFNWNSDVHIVDPICEQDVAISQ